MAALKLSILFTGIVLSTFMSDFLGASPVGKHEKEEVAEAAEETPASSSDLQKLVRNRRNIDHYKRLPEFWTWYKYYVDTNNQEGIENLDQLYRVYLQNKHRLEGKNSYNHYLTHLSEIYKACAKSNDPDCIAEHTSKPTAKVVMPAALKQAALNVCNPYLDPYCSYAMSPQTAPEELIPVPVSVKSPASILTPLPVKVPYQYYAPLLQPFLTAEQRVELLRICSPSDVDCLQYHLRAAYGFKPAPSYSYSGCDPTKDPYCRSTLMAKPSAGQYHVYPSCNPAIDPYCITSEAPAGQSAEQAPQVQYCNPLFDKDCNPLIATKMAALTKQPAPLNLLCDPHYDPYCLTGGTAVSLKGKKTSAAITQPECHPYDPSCSRFTPPASIEAKAAKTTQDGIVLPHPDCDPEYDYNCRLRHAEPAADKAVKKPQDAPGQPESQHGDYSATKVAPEYPVPRFVEFLKGYMGHYKK